MMSSAAGRDVMQVIRNMLFCLALSQRPDVHMVCYLLTHPTGGFQGSCEMVRMIRNMVWGGFRVYLKPPNKEITLPGPAILSCHQSITAAVLVSPSSAALRHTAGKACGFVVAKGCC